MKTVVYGSWHLAEVYAVGLCELGHSVTILSNEQVRKEYEKGKPPVYESGIEEGIQTYSKKHQLFFSSDPNDEKNKADVCFFAEDCKVTEDGIDMQDIENKFDELVKTGNWKIFCISAQLPVGTSREWQKKYPHVKIVYYPEFLRLGDALSRFTNPDYTVLGGEPEDTAQVMRFFEPIKTAKFEVTLEEAEMSKHAANIFVAMTVSFVSELTKFSQLFDINIERIGKMLREDKRVGPKAYTMPGMGFSGETVERDIRVLINEGKKHNIRLPMFEQVIAVNNEHNKFIERELRSRFKSLKNVSIAFIGATYKPSTSTLRGSLVRDLIENLQREGARIRLFDSHVESHPCKVETIEQAFRDADVAVISVAKKEFRDVDMKKLALLMKKKIFIDAANLLATSAKKELGLEYYVSIGRGKIK